MKITITQTKIVFDIPDEPPPQPAAKRPDKPDSFFDRIFRDIERSIVPKYLETQNYGTFLEKQR